MADDALAIDENDLRNVQSVIGVVLEEDVNGLACAEAYRIVHLEVAHEIGDEHLRHIVECHTERLESLRAVLGLELRHQLRRVLTVGASGEQELNRDHLPSKFAEKNLTAVR